MPTLNWIGKEAVVNHHLQVPNTKNGDGAAIAEFPLIKPDGRPWLDMGCSVNPGGKLPVPAGIVVHYLQRLFSIQSDVNRRMGL